MLHRAWRSREDSTLFAKVLNKSVSDADADELTSVLDVFMKFITLQDGLEVCVTLKLCSLMDSHFGFRDIVFLRVWSYLLLL